MPHPAWLLTALLAAAPAQTPKPTVWARAGGRGWSLCQDLARQATVARVSNESRAKESEPLWPARARECPHQPEVLTQAAIDEIVRSVELTQAIPSLDQLPKVVEEHREIVAQALTWVEASLAESERRGEEPPPRTRYYRAYSLIGLGRYDEGAKALREAERAGDVERWRTDRLMALCALFKGDLARALRLAHRAKRDAPVQNLPISRYILAVVLDRAGAPAAGLEVLKRLRRTSRDSGFRQAVESVLPIHERLYTRALFHQSLDGEVQNSIRLWDAYLSRPEPEDPERKLAERHRAELLPPPAPVGGPG